MQQESTFDAAGNLVASKTNNGATITTYVVDAAGRTTSSTLDPGGLNRTTTQTLTPDDYLINTTQSDSTGVLSSTDMLNDPMGRNIATTVAKGTFDPVARWKLNETTGTKAADSAGNTPATASGGVTWSTDHGGSAAFDGTGRLTGGPTVDTGRSFTVSAWVYLTDSTLGVAKAVSGVGIYQNSFDLRYESATKVWRFRTASADTPTATGIGGAQTADNAAAANTWTHLLGVYDSAAKTVKLYVNGTLADTTNNTTMFTATKSTHLGGGVYNGSQESAWKGRISDVQTYSRALTATEIGQVYAGTAPAVGAGVIRTSRKLDQSGLAVAATDPNGQTTDYSLDEAGRVAVTTQPAVLTETGGGTPVLARPVSYVGYDTFGAVTETKNPNGNVSVIGYNAAGEPESKTLPNYTPPGSSTPITAISTMSYNNLGQLTTSTDPLNHTDQLRLRPVRSGVEGDHAEPGCVHLHLRPARGPVVRHRPDRCDVHRHLRLSGPAGHLDPGGTPNPGRTTPPNTRTGRDGWPIVGDHAGRGHQRPPRTTRPGNRVTATDGAGKTTTFTYDGLGRQTRTTLPDNTYTTTIYDAVSRPTVTKSYDAANTLLRTTSTDYDAAGNVTGSTDALGTRTTFGYDATGLLASEAQPKDASSSITTTFGYDLAGNRTRFTDGRGNPFVTTFNSWGLPESQIEPATASYPNLADRTFTTAYDAAGRVASRLAPGGVTVTNSYNTMGQLIGQAGAGAEATTAARTFDYDLAGRLTTFTGPGATNTLSYDDRGLLLSASGGSGTSTFSYNDDGQMASRADAAGTTNYTYTPADSRPRPTRPPVWRRPIRTTTCPKSARSLTGRVATRGGWATTRCTGWPATS